MSREVAIEPYALVPLVEHRFGSSVGRRTKLIVVNVSVVCQFQEIEESNIKRLKYPAQVRRDDHTYNVTVPASLQEVHLHM